MSEATVDVPAVGRVKKQYVIAAAALVAGIVGYAYWRAGQAPADFPAYTDEDVVSDGVTDTAGGVAGGSANSGGLGVDNSTSPDTDAEWVQFAREALAGTFDDAALAVALGRYIGHETLTSAQADMVRAAIGSLGYPPGGKYPIDTVTGSTPSALTEPKNLRVIAKDTTSVTIAYDPVPGAALYRAYRSGASTNVGATDGGNHSIRISGLEPNREYSFQIAADTIGGKPGPKSQPIKAKTAAITLAKPAKPSVSATATTAKVSTKAVSGARGYHWYLNGQLSNETDAPTWTFTGLKRGTTYRVNVAADTPTQGRGPKSDTTTFKTKTK